MKIVGALVLVLGVAAVLLIGVALIAPYDPNGLNGLLFDPPMSTAAPTGCQPHIEVYDAEYWARELGRPATWVQAHHTIALWDSLQTRRKVGEMRPGSRAVILEETSDGYRVRSPLDHRVGWISRAQVARTLRQDTDTRRPC